MHSAEAGTADLGAFGPESVPNLMEGPRQMAIAIQCPECKRAYNLRDDYAGQTVRCRQCQAAFPVGGSSKEAGKAGGPLKRPSTGVAVALSLGMFLGLLSCCIGVPVLALTTLGLFAKPNPPVANRSAVQGNKQGTPQAANPKSPPKPAPPANAQPEEKDLQTLLTDLNSADPASRAKALKALARQKDPQVLAAVAQRLKDAKDRREAANTLAAYGPSAEEEVGKYLTDTDKDVRREACRILKKIGTAKSKAALEAAAKDKDRNVAREAQGALKEIDKRP